MDAADFAEMLLRMYLRWAERHGYHDRGARHLLRRRGGHQVRDVQGQGARSRTGRSRCEQGTHRLVRISPFDNQGRRQTSFAGVEVMPVVERTDHVDIPEDELRVDVFRSSGPGGQGVNTTDSAVRITHLPTGIVVTCQNERSQIQNKAAAMPCCRPSCSSASREEERARMNALKDDDVGLLGQPDAQLRPAPVPDGQGPADEARDRQHRAQCSTATSTSSSMPGSAGGGLTQGVSARTAGEALGPRGARREREHQRAVHGRPAAR